VRSGGRGSSVDPDHAALPEGRASVVRWTTQRSSLPRTRRSGGGRDAIGTARIAARIEEVRQVAGETGGAATEVQATSGELAEQAERLRRKVDEVLGGMRAA
jgi:methyl-accepting chemotaxis protein